MQKWNRQITALTLIFVFMIFCGEAVAEETILRQSEHFSFGKGYGGGPPPDYCLQNCSDKNSVPNIISNYLLQSYLNESDLVYHRQDTQLRSKFFFTVYTKDEVYSKAEVDAKLAALQETVNHNKRVFDDTTRAVLGQIDKLPVELPTNSAFYQQVRERLKADIAADLEKAKRELAGQPQ